jgi:hypothetical protein
LFLSRRKNGRLLTAEFHRLADVPPEVEWFAIKNKMSE